MKTQFAGVVTGIWAAIVVFAAGWLVRGDLGAAAALLVVFGIVAPVVLGVILAATRLAGYQLNEPEAQ